MNEDHIETVVLDKNYTNNNKPAVSPADTEIVANNNESTPSSDHDFTQTYSYLT